MIKIIPFILAAEVLGVSGQILFKKSVNRLHRPSFNNIRSYMRFAGGVLGIPAVWLGFVFIALGMVLWLMALAQTDLSIAFPIDSMQYIVILVFSRIFLGERIDGMKLAGTLLVVLGIVFVSLS